MFSFIIPFMDGSVWDVRIGAKTLEEAVDEYCRYFWNPGTIGAIGVWHNHCLAGRILPVEDKATGDNVPLWQPWP